MTKQGLLLGKIKIDELRRSPNAEHWVCSFFGKVERALAVSKSLWVLFGSSMALPRLSENIKAAKATTVTDKALKPMIFIPRETDCANLQTQKIDGKFPERPDSANRACLLS